MSGNFRYVDPLTDSSYWGGPGREPWNQPAAPAQTQTPNFAQKAAALPDATVGMLQNLYGTIGGRQNPYQMGGELHRLARDNAHADIQGRYANLAGNLQNPTSPAHAKALRQLQLGAASEMSRASSGMAQRLAELGAGWQGQQDDRMMNLAGLVQSGYGQAFNQHLEVPRHLQQLAMGDIGLNSARATQPFIDQNTIAQAKLAALDAGLSHRLLQEEGEFQNTDVAKLARLWNRYDNLFWNTPIGRTINTGVKIAAPIVGTLAGGPAGGMAMSSVVNAIPTPGAGSAGMGGLQRLPSFQGYSGLA